MLPMPSPWMFPQGNGIFAIDYNFWLSHFMIHCFSPSFTFSWFRTSAQFETLRPSHLFCSSFTLRNKSFNSALSLGKAPLFVTMRKLEFTLFIAFKLNSPCDLLKPRHVKTIPNCLVGSRSIRQLSNNTILPKSLQECFALSIYLAFKNLSLQSEILW